MEACYGGTDVMEKSCAMARGKDINRKGMIEMRYHTVAWIVACTCSYSRSPAGGGLFLAALFWVPSFGLTGPRISVPVGHRGL
jgi:hypothetical protein